MTSTSEQLRVLLDDTAFRALELLAGASTPVSGRALARALDVSPTTALAALATLQKVGFATSAVAGRSSLWSLDERNPMVRGWLEEASGAAPDGHDRRPQLTAVIFTALQLEYSAVAAHLPERRPRRVRATHFEEGTFAGNHADWTVYVAELGAGNTRTAIEVTSAVRELGPHLVLFAGVAGSVKPKDLCQGDVIVADRVYNIHSGKDSWNEAQGSVHLTRPLSFTAAHGAVQLAMKVRRSDWISEFTAEAVNANGKVPRVEIRPIAAGEVVHADNSSWLMAKIRENFNDAAAVDMESLGLYEAAHRDDFPALTVRGISDCVGDKQPDSDIEWQPRAAEHAAAFAFALLRGAEPEDFPRQHAITVPAREPAGTGRLSPVEMLLRLPPPVALAYEWALPIAGARATAALEEFVKLGGQPATWLSRFRHRPPPLFRGEGSDALWVLVAEFADSYQHPTAPWLYEQAADRWADDILSPYLCCRGAVAGSRDPDPEKTEELLARAEGAAPAGRRLWEYFRAALGSDIPALLTATPAVIHALDLVFPGPVMQALAGPGTTAEPDDDFAAFVEELAERHPAFLEQTRLTVALATASILQRTPGQISAAQMLLEELTDGLPAYREGQAGTSALSALIGPRSSNVLLELARTLCVRAADRSSRDMSFDPDAALARAEELARLARDRRQDWGGPTGEALAVEAQARAATGDIRAALRLLIPPPAGTARAAESASQPVIRVAAELAVGAGNIELALELAARLDEPLERRLATALALTLRNDSHPEAAAEYRLALDEQAMSERADQQIRALLGLSMVAELSDSELARLHRLDAEMADLIRAQSFLTAGRISQAQILARRYPNSDGALQLRVSCLLSQGKTTDAVSALETYAARCGDERFLLQAALLAMSSGAAEEASRLAGSVASSNDPARRKTAREILIDAASSRGDWDTVLAEARRLASDQAAAEADPDLDKSLKKYRWAQAHALHQLRRMNEAFEVIRAEPRLVPGDLNQARLVASILRTIAPSVAEPSSHQMAAGRGITQAEVLAAVTEAAQAFPEDEELVATAVMTAVSMPDSEPTNYGLMTRARQLHQQFFERFPNSKLIHPIPLDNALTGLQEMLRTQVAPAAEAAEQMQRSAITGQIPISVCISAFGRNYAEALIRNTVGCYVIRDPDDRISAQEADAARRALDGTVVLDTSALFLAPVTLGDATGLRAHFERLLVAAPQRDDILQARASLMMRSSGWLGWDPLSERPTFVQYDPAITERWAGEADNLARALEWCDVIADPPPDHDDPRHKVWSAPIRLARERGVSLIADDVALRAVARNEGVPAFGSLQLLSVLVEDHMLPADALDESYRRLMGIRAAELPILGRLRDIAEDEGWNPAGYAGFLLQRPTTWTPLARGWQDYTALITALPAKKPEEVAVWCTAAMNGLSLTTAPSTVPAVSAALVVWTLLELQDATVLSPLLASADRIVRHFAPSADTLEAVVQRLVMTVRQVTPPEMVGSIVLPLLSGLEKEAHAKAITHFFTMP